MNRVIVNADDFGLNESTTNAIAEAFEKNLISSTTMLANGDAFDLAIEYAKKQLRGKVGIHFALHSVCPLTKDIGLCKTFVADGIFHGYFSRKKRLTKFEKESLYKEFSAQVEKVEKQGIKITHADSHHHIHQCTHIAPIIVRVCKERGIEKIRIYRNIGKISLVKRLVKWIFNRCLKKKFTTTDFFGSISDVEYSGIKDLTEVMVHPNYNEQGELIDEIYVNDLPTGEKLISVSEKFNCSLISYGELQCK